jgi:hypothetical protein
MENWEQARVNKSIREGKMDISHAQFYVSVRPNGGFLTDRGRNGTEGKEV